MPCHGSVPDIALFGVSEQEHGTLAHVFVHIQIQALSWAAMFVSVKKKWQKAIFKTRINAADHRLHPDELAKYVASCFLSLCCYWCAANAGLTNWTQRKILFNIVLLFHVDGFFFLHFCSKYDSALAQHVNNNSSCINWAVAWLVCTDVNAGRQGPLLIFSLSTAWFRWTSVSGS